ncbi:MAG: hypothetical protein V4808_04480 [Pseudomonadota bacterium]
MAEERIVSIGFLTERDLVRLGTAFTNHIPVPADDIFGDLLAQLDQIEAVQIGQGISIIPSDGAKPA